MAEILILGLMLGSLYGLLGMGIVLVYKASRVLNFAQGEFGTFGVYIAWFCIMKMKLPWLLGALIAIVFMIALALVFERLVIRQMLEGPRLAITVATLGLMSLLGFTEIMTWGLSPQILRPVIVGQGPRILGIFISPTRMIAIVAALIIAFGLMAFIKRTTFGLGLLASAQDAVAVRLMGIRLRPLSAFTWASAAAFGTIAGILAITSVGTFEPFAMTSFFLVPAIAAALLGGLTSIPGAFAGGLLVGILQAALRINASFIPGVELAGAFAVLIIVLLVRPQGLFGKAA
jgi:branched-chain amino acid transport system permease protein